MNTETQELPMSQAARQDLTHVHEPAGQVVRADSTTVLEIISRVAADPAVDIEKLKGLMDLHERIADRSAAQTYNDAMNACQAEMEPVRKDANNPSTKSRYATFAALDRALRPIYTRHGFAVSFDTADCPKDDHVRVVAKVSHSAGHREAPRLDMPADGKGAKGGDVMTKTHAIGAATTYGRRYLLGMIFNIAVGEDDDGNSNGGRGSVKNQSRAAQDAIAEINAIDLHDATALVLWKKNKAPAWKPKVSDAEWQQIVSLWNRRAARAKPEGEGDA